MSAYPISDCVRTSNRFFKNSIFLLIFLFYFLTWTRNKLTCLIRQMVYNKNKYEQHLSTCCFTLFFSLWICFSAEKQTVLHTRNFKDCVYFCLQHSDKYVLCYSTQLTHIHAHTHRHNIYMCVLHIIVDSTRIIVRWKMKPGMAKFRSRTWRRWRHLNYSIYFSGLRLKHWNAIDKSKSNNIVFAYVCVFFFF